MSGLADNTTAQTFAGPPSQDVINLTIVDTVLSSIFFFVAAWVAWKHGKAGMLTWPTLCSCFLAKLIAAIYQLCTRENPAGPNTVSIITDSSVLACISLAIFGVLYECNSILPTPPKRKREKALLGFLHIINTVGLTLATFGGSPTATGGGGVQNPTLDKLGNVFIVLALVISFAWMPVTYRKIRRFHPGYGQVQGHPNAVPARRMFWAAFAASVFWAVRLGHGLVYSVRRDLADTLDPVNGSFQTRLVLIFGTWLGASVALIVGGWLGMKKGPRDEARPRTNTQVLFFSDPEMALRAERRRRVLALDQRGRPSDWSVPGGGSAPVESVTVLAEAGGEKTSKFQVLRQKVSQMSFVR